MIGALVIFLPTSECPERPVSICWGSVQGFVLACPIETENNKVIVHLWLLYEENTHIFLYAFAVQPLYVGKRPFLCIDWYWIFLWPPNGSWFGDGCYQHCSCSTVTYVVHAKLFIFTYIILTRDAMGISSKISCEIFPQVSEGVDFYIHFVKRFVRIATLFLNGVLVYSVISERMHQ